VEFDGKFFFNITGKVKDNLSIVLINYPVKGSHTDFKIFGGNIAYEGMPRA